jgi:tRNA (adenine22-N1)-methyltransferase
MKMELTRRMKAVAGLVSEGYKIADIGTDHAYIPIYLIERKKIPEAIAMDINEGPLSRAREHVTESGFLDLIQLRRSDGMENLVQGEVESAVIAGMGGALVIKILEKDWNLTVSLKECILQPQSEIAKVRAFLIQEGFLFLEEDMILEEGKFYPMMKVIPPQKSNKKTSQYSREGKWTETEIRYGRYLLKVKHPILKKYLEKEKKIKTDILYGLTAQNSTRAKQRIKELEQELGNIEKGLKYYAL